MNMIFLSNKISHTDSIIVAAYTLYELDFSDLIFFLALFNIVCIATWMGNTYFDDIAACRKALKSSLGSRFYC